MALSLTGWINGMTATGLVFYGCVFGYYLIRDGKKTEAKLLSILGLAIIFVGFLWLGIVFDFFSVLLTGRNINNTYGIVGILCFMWLPLAVVCNIYVTTEILIPDKKKIKMIILAIYVALGIIFEIFLFLNPISSFNYIYPDKNGEALIDEPINIYSPLGIISTIFFITTGTGPGIGILIKGLYSEGVLRKKLLWLSIANIALVTFGIFEGFPSLGVIIIFFRIGMIFSFWAIYYALREEPEKKVKPQKEVKVEGALFRIAKKPDQITEEEVTISKEKKICLVCKGKVGRFMYMCPKCETFYCEKCARALIELENACWACITAIDESRPVKPFKKEEEVAEIEISEKSKK